MDRNINIKLRDDYKNHTCILKLVAELQMTKLLSRTLQSVILVSQLCVVFIMTFFYDDGWIGKSKWLVSHVD